MSETFKTNTFVSKYREPMKKPTFAVIGIVATDMVASLAFYRDLGWEIPSDAETQPHVVVDLPSGMQIAFDTLEIITAYDPQWTPASGGSRVALSFSCESGIHVDEVYREMTNKGL